MQNIHTLKRDVNRLSTLWRRRKNCHTILCSIQETIDQLLDINYQNQSKSHIVCRYWRANCCAFGKKCRFQHPKINSNPLLCPFGDKCNRRINGVCICAISIRKKFNLKQENNFNQTNSGM